ncbi:MAG: hypothetical protein JWO31_1703 [Phycisphaerales bacterium]|nr:hypothetical protein [Phycisphaerales bacterium]
MRVEPLPAILGVGKDRRTLDWDLRYNGIRVCLKRESSHGNGPPSGIVEIDGEACLRRGGWQCWKDVLGFVSALGGDVIRETMSRVDMCLDLPGQPTEPFLTAHAEGRFVTRAKKWTLFGGSDVSLYFGTHPLQFFIYDKLAQVTTKKAALVPLMAERRWGGAVPPAATRVEYRLGRAALASRGVTTVDSYFTFRSEIAGYLTSKWLRLVAAIPSKGNESRAKLLPLWTMVAAGYAEWTGAAVTAAKLKPVPVPVASPDNLMKQVVGIYVTLAARAGKEFKTDAEFRKYAAGLLAKQLPSTCWQSKLADKFAEAKWAAAAAAPEESAAKKAAVTVAGEAPHVTKSVVKKSAVLKYAGNAVKMP